jgi:hypothetical protein
MTKTSKTAPQSNTHSKMKQGMSLMSKAEITALYNRCKVAVPICTMLEARRTWTPEPKPTPVVTPGNITAQGLTMDSMVPLAQCCNIQCQFMYLWHKGILNCMDYDRQQYTQSSYYLSWVTSSIIIRTIASTHTFTVWLPLSSNSKGEEKVG